MYFVEEGVPGREGCTSKWKVYRGEKSVPIRAGCTWERRV